MSDTEQLVYYTVTTPRCLFKPLSCERTFSSYFQVVMAILKLDFLQCDCAVLFLSRGVKSLQYSPCREFVAPVREQSVFLRELVSRSHSHNSLSVIMNSFGNSSIKNVTELMLRRFFPLGDDSL